MVISVLLSQMTEQLPSCSLLLAPCPLKVELVKQAKLELLIVNFKDQPPLRIARNSPNCLSTQNFRFSRAFHIFLTANDLRSRDATCRVRRQTTERSVTSQRSVQLICNGRSVMRQPTLHDDITERSVADDEAQEAVKRAVKHTKPRCFTLYFAFLFCLDFRKKF